MLEDEKECLMQLGSGNIKFTFYNDANEVVDELSESPRWSVFYNKLILFLIQFNRCITIVIKKVLDAILQIP